MPWCCCGSPRARAWLTGPGFRRGVAGSERRVKRKAAPSGGGWALVEECGRCGRPEDRCACPAPPPSTGPATLRLRIEKRCGKPVTVLAAEGLGDVELQALGKELRARCGTGGTVKDGTVELQGEHRDRLRPLLAGRGYRVKG